MTFQGLVGLLLVDISKLLVKNLNEFNKFPISFTDS